MAARSGGGVEHAILQGHPVGTGGQVSWSLVFCLCELSTRQFD